MTQNNETERKRKLLRSLFVTLDESNQANALMVLKTLKFAQTALKNAPVISTPTP